MCTGWSVADAVVVFGHARAETWAEAELIQAGIRANPVTAATADVIAAAVAGLWNPRAEAGQIRAGIRANPVTADVAADVAAGGHDDRGARVAVVGRWW